MMLLFVLLLTIGGGSIIYGMIKIQWIDGDEWRARGDKREKDLRTDPAQRGNIYSSDGKILATTIPVCDLYLDLYKGKDAPIHDTSYNKYIDTICLLLARAVPDKSAQYFRDKLDKERKKSNPGRCFLVRRGLSYSCWRAVCRIPGWSHGVVHQVDNRNVVRQVRAHIYGRLGENVIGMYDGFANKYTGLEGYYDSLLRGQDGIYICHRLTRGVWLADESPNNSPHMGDSVTIDSMSVQPKIDGTSIVAAMDTRYQDIAEAALRSSLEQYNALSGCAILMEVSTGYVLACSNLRFDTTTHRYEEVMYGNVAVSDHYEPGSTFKTVLMAAMLNDNSNKIDTAQRVLTGKKTYSSTSGTIDDGHGGGGMASVKEVLVHSSNVGMCELGWHYYGHRRDDLKNNVLKMFPYGNLHPDLNCSEGASWVNDVTPDRDFLNFCYGYSTMVNPLQVATFYNAIAGNGRMVKPLFCKAILHDGIEEPIAPIVLKDSVCSQRTCDLLKGMLLGVVDHGTGRILKSAQYGIAGKTGTSTIRYNRHGANEKLYNASFGGFFPADNPKYSCLVVVRRVAVDGSRAAAPVFKKIADCVVAIDKEIGSAALKAQSEHQTAQMPHFKKGCQQQLMEIYSQLKLPYYSKDSNAHWVVKDNGFDKYIPPKGIMPDCRGMSIRDALALLRGMGLKVKFSGYGKVTNQQPNARTPIRAGGTVILRLGNSRTANKESQTTNPEPQTSNTESQNTNIQTQTKPTT